MSPSEKDWVFLPHNGSIGKVGSFKCEYPPGRPVFKKEDKRLTPGKYYLQMVFFGRFTSEPPFQQFERERFRQEDINAWIQRYAPDFFLSGTREFTDELFRSNVAEFELIAPSAEEASKNR